MPRRDDDQWLPLTDDDAEDWRESVKDEMRSDELDDEFLDQYDTQTLAWMLHHLESD